MYPYFEQGLLLRAILENSSLAQEDVMFLELYQKDPKQCQNDLDYGTSEQDALIPEVLDEQCHLGKCHVAERDLDCSERVEDELADNKLVPTNRVLEVFGYVPSIPAFTEDEQDAFPKYAEKIMKPSLKRMKKAGRYIGRFSPMPGKSHAEMVQNYYNRKYFVGIRDRYPLPPRPAFKSAEKNIKNGFNKSGNARLSKTPHGTLLDLETLLLHRSSRIRNPSSMILQDHLDDINSDSQIFASSSGRKRTRSNSSSPTPAPKRAKTQKQTSTAAKVVVSARSKTTSRKRSIEHAELAEETPERIKQTRNGAGHGEPKNIDEAFLKIVKRRFIQARDIGKRGDNFMEHFLGSEFHLPALIPYSQRPIRKKGPENDRVPVDTIPQQLNMSEETFEMAQQCLILTWYILQEQRRRVEPENARRWKTSQWQHCAISDANNLHDLGDEMTARGMFTPEWCPALYVRAESDLAALAKWEDDNAPQEGFWPRKGFCKPRMVWWPESSVDNDIEHPATEGDGMMDSGEDFYDGFQLPFKIREIINSSGIPAGAILSVHQCVLRAAWNHVQMTPNELDFKELIADAALREIHSRECEEEPDMCMLAVVRGIINAGELSLQMEMQPTSNHRIKYAQRNVANEYEAEPRTSPSSSGTMSTNSPPSLAFSTPDNVLSSPDRDALQIADPEEAYIASVPLLGGYEMSQPQYFDHLSSPDNAPMYWNGHWWTKAKYKGW